MDQSDITQAEEGIPQFKPMGFSTPDRKLPDTHGADISASPYEFDVREFKHPRPPGEIPINDIAKLNTRTQKYLKKQLGKYARQRRRKLVSHSDVIIVCLDTEYQVNDAGDGNIILSYQYVVSHKGKRCSGIIYTDSKRVEGRIRFEKYIGTALNDALKKCVIEALPKSGDEIVVAAHWLRADLFTFAGAFHDFKTKISGIRKTVASLKDTYGVDPEEIGASRVKLEDITYYDPNGHAHTVNISFYDTLLLTPAGRQSLAAIGKLVGCEKIEISDDYIRNMGQLLIDNPELFEAYAINDAMICSLFMDLMIAFAKQELGVDRIPFTLGGTAVKSFKHTLPVGYTLDELFGYTRESILKWNNKDDPNKGPRTVKKRIPEDALEVLECMAIKCYHGGRNEAFHSGPTEEGTWHDYDGPSFYTTIAMGLRQLDYELFKETKDVNDFKGDICGMAKVKFSVPAHVKYPPLPMRASNNRGLFFVREGISHCTAQEIEVAVNLGVKIEIIYGFVIPWKSGSPRIFKRFMRTVRGKRLYLKKQAAELKEQEVQLGRHIANIMDGKSEKLENTEPLQPFESKKESLENQRKSLELFEKLWKELGNSLYGKLAQGLRGKRQLEVQTGISKKIPPSEITNALFAMHVTGVGRAVMCEMLNSIEEPYRAVSVTTDGFLTNAPLDKIKLDGPVCSYFRELYSHIDPDGGEILEEKNRATQVIVAKTRGQATALEAEGWEEKKITAKAGVKVPDYEDDHNEYFLMLYLERHPGAKVDASSLTSTRTQVLEHKDLIMNEKMQFMNLEPDCKRRLINPRLISTLGFQHIACDTEPHRSLEVGDYYRTRFDAWRKKNCLKEIEDWESWDDFIETSLAVRGSGMRIQPGDKSDAILRRNFVRAFAQEIHGLTRDVPAWKFSEWLCDEGYFTKESEVSRTAKIYHRAVPVTKRTVALLKLILSRYSNFKYERFFHPDRLHELRMQLQASISFSEKNKSTRGTKS
ncbi:hypothetical protein ACMXYR_14445 [Neptuniibacter sp. QD29_5]|uniref:hypothetical protein n=1 Tax=Neptuniibacter sp. QD29_5 TaxID=3398207 RepID=UPI0039F46FB7